MILLEKTSVTSSIENMTTAAQAPFPNGVVECYGETLKETMRKLKSDLPQQSFEKLLNKAVLAHNALDSNLGFNPILLSIAILASTRSSIQ